MTDDDPIHALARDLTERVAAIDEAELKRMLGLWVSEIEPEVMRDAQTSEIIGLRMIHETSAALDGEFVRSSPRYIESRRRLLALA